MKMKMTLAAGALALAFAGQASAAIVSGATGSSSLVLSIWDTTSATSYTGVVGNLDFASFSAGVSGTASALVANSSGFATDTFATNATLTSYLAGVTLGTTLWNVTAVDNSGTGAFGQKALVTTTNANIKAATGSAAVAQQNTTLQAAINNVDAFYTSAGAFGTPATFTSADGAAYAGTGMTTNSKTKLNFDTTATIGSSLNFWYLTPSSTMTTAKASVAQFNGGASAATWTLDAAGNLTFANGAPAVAPVPEPGEWLLMLSGLALIGFIATRRKEEGSVTFA